MNMTGFGIGEILLIAMLVLIVFGPRRLPEVTRTIGKGIREFRKGMNEIQRELEAAGRETQWKSPPTPSKPATASQATIAGTATAAGAAAAAEASPASADETEDEEDAPEATARGPSWRNRNRPRRAMRWIRLRSSSIPGPRIPRVRRSARSRPRSP